MGLSFQEFGFTTETQRHREGSGKGKDDERVQRLSGTTACS
jgi:hypothetical protein